jgi:hypothetical protein
MSSFAGVPILCPRCVEPIPFEHVEWDAHRATCGACGLILVLEGDLVPQQVVRGYPDRLLELRPTDTVPEGAKLVVERMAHSTRIRFGGWLSWLSKRICLAPDVVEVVTIFGGRLKLDQAEVVGFVPIQHVLWVGTSPEAVTWRIRLLRRVTTPNQRFELFTMIEVASWEAARHMAASLKEALEFARQPATAYRG